jgi:hypothetical protein
MNKDNKNEEFNNMYKNLHISNVSKNCLDKPSGYATTAELMLMFGKSVDDSLDIHNDLEKIVKDGSKF